MANVTMPKSQNENKLTRKETQKNKEYPNKKAKY